MHQEIEFEYKTLLTKEDFDKLNLALAFPPNAIKQVNYYFETADFQLKEKGCALRIREKNTSFILTLKQPHDEGILETHEKLTKTEFDAFLQNKIINKNHIGKLLMELGIKMSDLQYYGSLTTYRKSFIQNQIEYVLDESHYGKVMDYELEVEAPSMKDARNAFEELLKQHKIVKQASTTKIERFFKELYNKL